MTTCPVPRSTESIDLVLEFLGLAFAISWIAAGAFAFADIRPDSPTGVLIVVGTYMWAPAIAASISVRRRGRSIRRSTGLRRGRLPWVAVGWLLPVVFVGGTIVEGIGLPGVTFTADYGRYLTDLGLPPETVAESMAALEAFPLPAPMLFLLQGLLAGLTVNALAAAGEKFGWRGLLLGELAPLGLLARLRDNRFRLGDLACTSHRPRSQLPRDARH